MNKNWIYAFLGGALVGAGIALLYAPAKGEELREKIRSLCEKYGLCGRKGEATEEEIEEIIDQITAELNS